jgi:hypothetical protein
MKGRMPFPMPFLPALLIAALVAMAFPTYLWLVHRGSDSGKQSPGKSGGLTPNDSPLISAPADSSGFPPPALGPEEAMGLARATLKARGAPLTNSYIDRVQFEREPQSGLNYWRITFLDNRYANDVPIKGGQIYVHVYLDKKVDVWFGE